jgi:EmrB/QacA subfamily drug resistance transporter
MITFDYGSLNISLAVIAKYFGVKIGDVAWLPTLYLLIITSSVLGFGKLADNIGFKKVLIAGIAIFALGAFFCAVSRNFKVLLISRSFQSLGLSLCGPCEVALITKFLPQHFRGRGLGIYATFQGLGMALGPAVGGLINTHLGWRANFLVALPFSLFILLAAIKKVPSKHAAISDSRFDFIGAILIFIFLAPLLYAVNSGTKLGWNNSIVITCFIASIVGFVLFIFRQKCISYPLLDLNLFRNLDFSFAVIAAFFGLFISVGIVFILPFYLEILKGLGVSGVGAIMALPAVLLMLLSPVCGYLSDCFGSRRLCCLGMVLVAIAFLIFSFSVKADGTRFIVLGLIFFGTGLGLFLAPNNKLVMSLAPAEKQGVASGVYKIFINAGSSIGIALFILVATQAMLFNAAKLHIPLSEARNHSQVMLAGARAGFIFGFFVSLITLLFSYLAKDKKAVSGGV